MKLKAFGIDTAGSILSAALGNKQLWADSKAFVVTASDLEMPGVQKKEKVKQDLKFIFRDLVEILGPILEDALEILVRMAFIYMKERAK